MTADLYGAGYHDQVSIDFSPTAIESMKQRHGDLDLQWEVMDVRRMSFEDTEFDAAIDKVSSQQATWTMRLLNRR